MDGSSGYYTKWSKSDRERKISYDITYMWNLKYDTNEFIYNVLTCSRNTDMENKLMVTKAGTG